MQHPWYAEAVRAAMPKPLDYREVPKAGHSTSGAMHAALCRDGATVMQQSARL
ncbi:MAG: hypothetical protein WKG52_02640 [Variovorax sp.]